MIERAQRLARDVEAAVRARPAGRLVLALGDRAGEHDIGGMAAEMAFRFLFSFFPLLIVTVALLGLIGEALRLEGLALQILDQARPFVPGTIFELLEEQALHLLEVGSGTFLTLGLLGTVWGASIGVQTMMKGLNKAYGAEQRPMWRRALWALGFAILIPPMGLVLLVLSVVGRDLARWAGEALGLGTLLVQVLAALQLPVLALLVFLGFSLLYHLLPPVPLRYRDALPGAAFATAAWLLLTFGFGLYVDNFARFELVYGSFVGIVVFMLWLNFVSMAMLVGAELNALLMPEGRRIWS